MWVGFGIFVSFTFHFFFFESSIITYYYSLIYIIHTFYGELWPACPCSFYFLFVLWPWIKVFRWQGRGQP